MKAQLFESKSEKEIRLANGVQFFSEENETKEAFVARVSEAIERDYIESLDLEEVDPAKYKKYSVKQLQASRKNKTGVELRIIQEILVQRGALEEHQSEGGTVYNGTLENSDIPEEGSEQEEQSTQEVESPKEEKAEDEENIPEVEESKPEKKEKPLRKQISTDDILAAFEEGEKNKGKIIEFKNKKGENIRGRIFGVRHDKRSGMVFYMTKVEERVLGKTIWAKDYTISEPTEEDLITFGRKSAKAKEIGDSIPSEKNTENQEQ